VTELRKRWSADVEQEKGGPEAASVF